MTPGPQRSLASWGAVAFVAVAAGLAAVEVDRVVVERGYKDVLATEAGRRAVEIMAVTLNGDVMGSVAALGLVAPAVKELARDTLPPQDPYVSELLRAVGDSYKANGVFIVDRSGTIRTSWYTIGRSLTGVDVRFRPYYQIAMKGRKNVYAAIGTTTGERALYFAAPLHDAAAASSPVIGATVARLDIGRIDAVLNAWPGPALLLSPQRIVFASNRGEWVERVAGAATAEELKAIRALKQFGNTFESGVPQTLPFDIGSRVAGIAGSRYQVASAPVQWNDPHGEWRLVLLGDLDAQKPVLERAIVGTVSGAAAFVLGALFLLWRRRLQRVDEQRRKAEAELLANAARLEADSATKSFIAEVLADLQKAESLPVFAGRFLSLVAPRVGVEYGLFYVLDEKSRLLSPVGGYGAAVEEAQEAAVGQGLVGQCASDAAALVLAEPAQAGIRIAWGGGELAPKTVMLLPAVQGRRVLGVVVLAALRPIDAGRRALLDALMPLLAMTLEILQRNLATRRQAQALAESEAFTRALMDSSPAGLFLSTIEGKARFASAHWTEMHGYTKEELVDFRTGDLYVDPDDRKSFVAALRATGRVQNYECRIRRKDGSEIWSLLNASLVKVGQEQLVATWVNDMTARHEAVERVREMADELAAIFEAATAGIAFVKDRAIVRGNGRLNELFGFSTEEQVGKSTRIWYPDDESYAAGGGAVYDALKRGETHHREQRLRRKDGSLFWCRLSGRAVDPADLSRGSVWILEEISGGVRQPGP